MIAGQIDRETWERPGQTIAEHTRNGPQPWNLAQYVVLHYTAATTTPETYDDVKAYIQAMQNDYVTNRGYSLGYNWCVDRHGRIWEIRGGDYRCAANGNGTLNRNGPAVLCLVNGSQPATPDMIASVKRTIAGIYQKIGKPVDIKGHGEIKPTACPGEGVLSQIHDGVFNPEQEAGMRYILKAPQSRQGKPWFVRWDGTWSYCTGVDRDAMVKDGYPIVEDNEERYDWVYKQVIGP